MIHRIDDIIQIIHEQGFLPFFAGEIPCFSLEEVTPPELWFPDDTVDGVWEWKGPVIIEGDCAYGKFYQGKACFISMEVFPDFVNYRRSRYSLSSDEQLILSALKEHQSLLSKELKRVCGYVKPRQKRAGNPLERLWEKEHPNPRGLAKSGRQGFDTAITRLQMATYVVTADFEYSYDKQGRRYGWGVARYCTPEDFFGTDRIAVDRTPEESKHRLLAFLREKIPQADDSQLERLIS